MAHSKRINLKFVLLLLNRRDRALNPVIWRILITIRLIFDSLAAFGTLLRGRLLDLGRSSTTSARVSLRRCIGGQTELSFDLTEANLLAKY